MEECLDLVRFPLDRLDGAAGAALVERCCEDLDRFGIVDLDGFVRPAAVRRALAETTALMNGAAHGRVRRHTIYGGAPDGVPPGHPALAVLRSSSHAVGADRLAGTVLERIHGYGPLAGFLARVVGSPVHPLADPLARLCVLRMDPGDALAWHFDDAPFAVTVLLQAPQFGGFFEYARDVRGAGDPNPDGVADLLAGRTPVRTAQLMPGTLNIFRGRDAAHRVTTVGGDRPRIIALLGFSDRPGVVLPEAERRELFGRAA